MSRTLYHERIEEWESGITSNYVSDYVEVWVRSWACEGMTPDVVIECKVLVDRKLVVDMRDAYGHGEADAYFIRLGIAAFDKLLAKHPTLSTEAHG